VISAVGHETDTSISDFVADCRAPTPSAAAEIVSFETQELLAALTKCKRQMQHLVMKTLSKARHDLNRFCRHPIFTSTTALLGPSMQKLDDVKELIDESMGRILQKASLNCTRYKRAIEQLRPERKIQENTIRLKQMEKTLEGAIRRLTSQRKRNFEQFVRHLSSLNPKSLLSKGYSILFSQKDGSVITSIKAVRRGDPVRIVLSDGEATATISETHES